MIGALEALAARLILDAPSIVNYSIGEKSVAR